MVEPRSDMVLDRTHPILIEEELKTSFLDYAMSVVVSRAIPDVRDGLKPVHRRVLYTMSQLGFHHNKPYHKSVRVVGEVLGRYHPHGDQAVYGTMVGLVQDFSKRYPLLDGQGNWGSVDGDDAAAMRYTEVRMQKIAGELLADLDKETVEFVPNFDESTVEPTVLPSRIPNLLINGTTGIAVGMATSIPPHNFGEVVDACLALMENEGITDEELFEKVPAPDFPTGGIICGRAGILRAYKTGRGNVVVRAVVEIEETKKGSALVVTELPYQVIKAELIIKIAELVKEKVIDGITNIREESDRRGMRLVIEIRKGESPQVILNQLYKHTSLQMSHSILMLGLIHNRPLVFSLRQLLKEFLNHREEVVYRRCLFDLKKARARDHILAGFIITLEHIDSIVTLIKQAQTPEQAMVALAAAYSLSEEQAKAVLEMRLQRLTGLEREKIHAEITELRGQIAFLESVLADRMKLRAEIVKELTAVRAEYGDKRRTRIEADINDFSAADLVPDEQVVVTLTRKGYIKRMPLVMYNVQHRGGKGKMGMVSLDESDDIVEDIFVAKNHDELLFFTNFGRVYSLSVYQVPESSRIAKGRAIVNLLTLTPGESVVKLLCARDFSENKYLVMLTKKGVIKRTEAKAFSNIRSNGIRAVTLNDGDELVFCSLGSNEDNIIISTAHGQGIRFKATEVRSMGRHATGVRGIRLREGDSVVGMVVSHDENIDILFATQRGYGKRVRLGDFRLAHRGGVGVRTIPVDKRNGEVIGLVLVRIGDDILLIDSVGKIIRLPSKEIRVLGRQAKGVRLIRLDGKTSLMGIVACAEGEAPASAETVALPVQDPAELAAFNVEPEPEPEGDVEPEDDEGDTQ